MQKRFFRAAAMVASALVVLFLASCGLDAGLAGGIDASAVAFADGDKTVDSYSAVLYAGQTTVVGSVDLTIDDDVLVVTYNTTAGWGMNEVHFAIGTKSSDIPVNRAGNPVVGHFPYTASNLAGVSSYEVRIPVATLGITDIDNFADTAVIAAAHAVVSNGSRTETAWAGSQRFVQRGSWATMFGFVLRYIDDNNGGDPQLGSETAFAYGGSLATSFQSFDGANRWGWTNGPLAEGSYTFAIYAGAGQSDITKGTLVGSLSVNYANGTAVVTYSMNQGFSMTETHLYVGTSALPTNRNGDTTLAPGQYGNVREQLNYVSTDSYSVSGLSGDVYLVAHAVVFGEY